MSYRDITCDPISGVRKIDLTAYAILDVLTQSTGLHVPVTDVNAAIEAKPGADLRWKSAARKALHNIGYVIDIDQHRQNTTWCLAATSDEVETYRTRVMRAVYSQVVTTGRMLSGQVVARPNDMIAAMSLRTTQLTAITLAGDTAVGRTTAQALADLDPLPLP